MNDVMHAEKRRESRLGEKVRIFYVTSPGARGESRSELLQAETVDVSEGGLRFHDSSGSIGFSMLEINLLPPDASQPITEFARVRWLGPASQGAGNEVGVQFVPLQASDHAAWAGYILQKKRKIAA